MDKKIRNMQLKVLDSFKKCSGKFSLAGGTALELFYLNHRFSKDLDFFSTQYEKKEIRTIVSALADNMKINIKIKDEFSAGNMASVSFYEIPIKGASAPLKLDFVEDVIIKKPDIRKFKGVPVYAAENIYHQKICAIAGTNLQTDAAGMEMTSGRNAARDIIDLFYLSKRIAPLSVFLRKMHPSQQRGMVKWYRSFSRHDFKIDFLDFELYDSKLDAASIIRHLEEEINIFMEELIS
jgi:predicted nucleotidyltransferase component of viral defense system